MSGNTTFPEKSSSYGKRVLLYFILFFVVVASVDAYFIIKALETHSGVVTENAYEKGLAFNDTLKKAKEQDGLNISDTITLEDSRLIWAAKDENGNPLAAKNVTAKIIRPLQKKYDFDVILTEKEPGTYESKINLPLSGKWTVKLEAEINGQPYYRTFDLIKK